MNEKKYFYAFTTVIFFLQCSDTVGWKGFRPVKKTGCWFVDGDILTGALHVL